jgi:putative endonuclease
MEGEWNRPIAITAFLWKALPGPQGLENPRVRKFSAMTLRQRRRAKRSPVEGPQMKEWSVYMLRCDKRYLYTGISNDVRRRVAEHVSRGRKAAKSTRPFASIELVYAVRLGSRSLASKIEHRVKKLPRHKKELIVSGCFSKDELLAFVHSDPLADPSVPSR